MPGESNGGGKSQDWKPSASPWLIAAAVMLATFMEVLDTSIASVTLPHIAGSLSASTDEATWVLTSYLVSNAIILPSSGWFSLRFGRKNFLIFCIVVFTISSFLCGAATSLGWILIARTIQGAGGGALQPLSQAILLESFPVEKRGVAMAIFSLVHSYESTDDAQVDGHLDAVSTRVMGTVQSVYVEDNQVVTAGQVLVELDPRDLDNALQQAKASYASAQAQLKAENPNVPNVQTTNETTVANNQDAIQSAQAAVIVAEQQYESRLAMLREAEANDAKTQIELVRYRGLVQKEEVSHEQYDNYVAAAKTQSASVAAAQAAAEAARKSIDQARSQLSQAQTRLQESMRNAPRNVLVRQAGVEARQAAVLSAQAQTDQAELNLSYTKICAPANGIVTNKTVEIGQRVEPGEQLLIVTQVDDVWITANFTETQLKKMHPGQGVDIQVDTYGRKYHGYIESMPGATGARTSLLPPENATGNFVKVVQRLPVRIRLNNGENNDHLWRPGMSVQPKVWLN